MVWDCFAASGPRELTILESTMNSLLYQRILEDNKRPVNEAQLESVTSQHDNEPNIPVNPPQNCWIIEKERILEWPGQIPDPVEQAMHERNKHHTAGKILYGEVGEKILSMLETIDSYKKHLYEVVSVKVGNTRY